MKVETSRRLCWRHREYKKIHSGASLELCRVGNSPLSTRRKWLEAFVPLERFILFFLTKNSLLFLILPNNSFGPIGKSPHQLKYICGCLKKVSKGNTQSSREASVVLQAKFERTRITPPRRSNIHPFLQHFHSWTTPLYLTLRLLRIFYLLFLRCFDNFISRLNR